MWVFACVRAIAEEIGRIGYEAYEKKADGTYEKKIDHELLDFLNHPNDYMIGFEMKYLIAAYLELTGKAFLYLEGVRNENSKPIAIHVLNPQYVKIVRDNLPNRIDRFVYNDTKVKWEIQPHEMIYIKYPNPYDPVEGLGTVEGIAEWIDADKFATQYNRVYFQNGAKLSGVLKSEKATTKAQIDLLRYGFEALHKGAEKAYSIGVLPKGTEYQEMGQAQKDMDFVNLQTMMRDKILAGFRVSKTVLGTAESDTNRSTAETADYVFAARTIRPKMEIIVSYINERLAPRFSKNIYISFEDPVPKNREIELKQQHEAVDGEGILTINEARDRFMGLPAVENGDVVLMSTNKVPLGNSMQTSKYSKQPKSIYPRKENKSTKTISNSIAQEAVKTFSKFNKKKIAIKTGDKELVIRLAPYQKKQSEIMKGINAAQKKEVLKNLSAYLATRKDTKLGELYDEGNYIGITIDLSMKNLGKLFAQAGTQAGEQVGLDKFDSLSPQVQEALRSVIELMAKKYNETTQTELYDQLAKAIANGASLSELREAVGQVYDIGANQRAELVAQTEVVRVANMASKEAWKQSGVVRMMKWETAQYDKVCQFCSMLEGKIISIEDNFFDQGAELETKDGQKMKLDYSDVGTPPLHPRCQCYIVPEEITI
jgi:HK97 family phage portal protein